MSARAQPNPAVGLSFWRDTIAWRGSITPKLLVRVGLFALYGALVAYVHRILPWAGVDPLHLTYTGGLLAVLLVLRTNAGHERWWDARKLWGGIVNQSRNLALKALAYGPDDPRWRELLVRWTAAFPHAARQSLRGARVREDFERVLVDPESSTVVVGSHHMPSMVAWKLAELLSEARVQGKLDGFAFMELDRERASLIDHVGGCERILRTPLPRVHTIKLRRFIVLYLLAVPLALASSHLWLTALATMLVAYPIFAIEQIGYELEDPFSQKRASHLPLDAICETIERDLLALLEAASRQGRPAEHIA